MSPETLTAEQAAPILKRSALTVRRLCHSGALRATKDGRQWLIRPDDIEEYLDSKANRPRRKRRSRAA